MLVLIDSGPMTLTYQNISIQAPKWGTSHDAIDDLPSGYD